MYDFHEELEKDIVVGNFDNSKEIKIAQQQKEKKNDNLKPAKRDCH